MTLLSFAMPSGATAYAKAVVLAKNAATGDAASFEISGGGKRSGAGSLAIIGSVVSLLSVKDAAASTWTATITISGNNLIVQATGALVTTIDWICILDIFHAE